jgi:hypothetical protein
MGLKMAFFVIRNKGLCRETIDSVAEMGACAPALFTTNWLTVAVGRNHKRKNPSE